MNIRRAIASIAVVFNGVFFGSVFHGMKYGYIFTGVSAFSMLIGLLMTRCYGKRDRLIVIAGKLILLISTGFLLGTLLSRIHSGYGVALTIVAGTILVIAMFLSIVMLISSAKK